MSLINEALKKAQKMRQGPAADESTSAPVAKRRSPLGARQVVILGGAVVAVAIVLATVAVLFLLPDRSAPEIAQSTASPAPPVPVAAAAPEPIPTVTAPTFLEPAATLAEPAPAESAAAPETTASAEPSPPPAADAPASEPAPASDDAGPAVGDAPPAVAAIPSGPVENPQVYDYLDTLQVAGIRASATDPKVLMNDRVFRLNDIVDRGLGLRITGISPTGLTFTDESGFEYEKKF